MINTNKKGPIGPNVKTKSNTINPEGDRNHEPMTWKDKQKRSSQLGRKYQQLETTNWLRNENRNGQEDTHLKIWCVENHLFSRPQARSGANTIAEFLSFVLYLK